MRTNENRTVSRTLHKTREARLLQSKARQGRGDGSGWGVTEVRIHGKGGQEPVEEKAGQQRQWQKKRAKTLLLLLMLLVRLLGCGCG